MSHFDGKNWSRTDIEDGRIIVRVYGTTYAGPDTDAAETYVLEDEIWHRDGEPVEDVDLLDDLDTLIAPVDHALVEDTLAPVPAPAPVEEPGDDHAHGDETHVH